MNRDWRHAAWIGNILIGINNQIRLDENDELSPMCVFPLQGTERLVCGHAYLALLKATTDPSYTITTSTCKLYPPEYFDEREESLREAASAQLRGAVQDFSVSLGKRHWMVTLAQQCAEGRCCVSGDPLTCKVIRYHFEPNNNTHTEGQHPLHM